MDLKHLRNIEDLKAFVAGSKRFTLKAKTIEDRYEIIEDLVHRFDYWRVNNSVKLCMVIV